MTLKPTRKGYLGGFETGCYVAQKPFEHDIDAKAGATHPDFDLSSCHGWK